MSTNQKLAFILLIIGMTIAAFAQQPDPLKLKSSAELGWSKSAEDAPKPKPLTAEEQQRWANLLTVEKQRAETLSQSTDDLLNTQPGPDSVTVHARYQSAWLALRLVRAEAREWLGKVQAAHDCRDCTVSADGKRLEPVKKDGGK